MSIKSPSSVPSVNTQGLGANPIVQSITGFMEALGLTQSSGGNFSLAGPKSKTVGQFLAAMTGRPVDKPLASINPSTGQVTYAPTCTTCDHGTCTKGTCTSCPNGQCTESLGTQTNKLFSPQTQQYYRPAPALAQPP